MGQVDFPSIKWESVWVKTVVLDFPGRQYGLLGRKLYQEAGGRWGVWYVYLRLAPLLMQNSGIPVPSLSLSFLSTQLEPSWL